MESCLLVSVIVLKWRLGSKSMFSPEPASAIACRSEPAPESFVFATVVTAPAGRATAAVKRAVTTTETCVRVMVTSCWEPLPDG